jgi:hypothetical protein
MLNGKEGKMALIPLTDAEIVPGRHASQFVNATKEFHWLDYMDTEVTSKDEKTIIGTIVVPVSSVKEGSEITSSSKVSIGKTGALSVEFVRGDKTFSFDFSNDNEGLILKK